MLQVMNSPEKNKSKNRGSDGDAGCSQNGYHDHPRRHCTITSINAHQSLAEVLVATYLRMNKESKIIALLEEAEYTVRTKD